jgi:hypothetical protein
MTEPTSGKAPVLAVTRDLVPWFRLSIAAQPRVLEIPQRGASWGYSVLPSSLPPLPV